MQNLDEMNIAGLQTVIIAHVAELMRCSHHQQDREMTDLLIETVTTSTTVLLSSHLNLQELWTQSTGD
jgi:hypothetical protein